MDYINNSSIKCGVTVSYHYTIRVLMLSHAAVLFVVSVILIVSIT